MGPVCALDAAPPKTSTLREGNQTFFGCSSVPCTKGVFVILPWLHYIHTFALHLACCLFTRPPSLSLALDRPYPALKHSRMGCGKLPPLFDQSQHGVGVKARYATQNQARHDEADVVKMLQRRPATYHMVSCKTEINQGMLQYKVGW